MSVGCVGGLQDPVRWSDIAGIAADMTTAMAALNVTPPAAFTNYLLYQQSSFNSVKAVITWPINSSATDICASGTGTGAAVFTAGGTPYTLTAAEAYAFSLGRLYFIGSNPSTLVSTNSPCFCCASARVLGNVGAFTLNGTSNGGNCFGGANFGAPCPGLLLAGELDFYSSRPGPRRTNAETFAGGHYDGVISFSLPACNGAPLDFVRTYFLTWNEAAGQYLLTSVQMTLSGYLGWNISSTDLSVLTDTISATLAGSCGALAGQVRQSLSAYIPEYCPVLLYDLVRTYPDTNPGGLVLAGSSVVFPWTTPTASGGASINCNNSTVVPMYCETLKHVDQLINQLTSAVHTKVVGCPSGINCNPCIPVESPSIIYATKSNIGNAAYGCSGSDAVTAAEGLETADMSPGSKTAFGWESVSSPPPGNCDLCPLTCLTATVLEVDATLSTISWSGLTIGNSYVLCWSTVASVDTAGDPPFIPVANGSLTFTATSTSESFTFSAAGINMALSTITPYLDNTQTQQDVELFLSVSMTCPGYSC